uniref:Uncharacterized protein n=1 Tax=Romanomermis culicivorax TaxID=13658 RepID=A0A915J974_ROMCU
MEFYDFFKGLSDEERIKIQNVLERDLDEQNRLKDNAENWKRQIDLLYQKRYLLSSTFQINKLFELGVICSLCGVTLRTNNGSDREMTLDINNRLMNKSSTDNQQGTGGSTISVSCVKCGLKTCVRCLGDKINEEKILCKLCYMIRQYMTITGVWCSKWKDIRCDNFEKSVKEVMHSEPNVSRALLDKFQRAVLRSS